MTVIRAERLTQLIQVRSSEDTLAGSAADDRANTGSNNPPTRDHVRAQAVSVRITARTLNSLYSKRRGGVRPGSDGGQTTLEKLPGGLTPV